jgi:hypothetical protein
MFWEGCKSRKVAGSNPDEVIDFFFFSVYLILPAALGSWVYSVYNRNEYQKKKMFLGSRARPVIKADNLTAICKPIVYTIQDSQNLTTL